MDPSAGDIAPGHGEEQELERAEAVDADLPRLELFIGWAADHGPVLEDELDRPFIVVGRLSEANTGELLRIARVDARREEVDDSSGDLPTKLDPPFLPR